MARNNGKQAKETVEKAPKQRRWIRAVAAILLCAIGFLLARAPLFRETTVIVDAGGCRLVTDVVDSGEDDAQGYVILFHGLAANKKIMSYLARGFALQGLRVFVPDLPGHGRTQGPFSFERAESCGDANSAWATCEHLIRRMDELQRRRCAASSDRRLCGTMEWRDGSTRNVGG